MCGCYQKSAEHVITEEEFLVELGHIKEETKRDNKSSEKNRKANEKTIAAFIAWCKVNHTDDAVTPITALRWLCSAHCCKVKRGYYVGRLKERQKKGETNGRIGASTLDKFLFGLDQLEKIQREKELSGKFDCTSVALATCLNFLMT